MGGPSTQVGDGESEVFSGKRQHALVAQEPGRNDSVPERPAVRGQRRDGLLTQHTGEKWPEPAFVRPGGVHHDTAWQRRAPPPVSFHRHGSPNRYRTLQNARLTSTEKIHLPPRVPRATSKRTRLKNPRRPMPAEG